MNQVLQKRLLQLIHDNMRHLEQRCSTNPPYPGSAVKLLNCKTKVGFLPTFFFKKKKLRFNLFLSECSNANFRSLPHSMSSSNDI